MMKLRALVLTIFPLIAPVYAMNRSLSLNRSLVVPTIRTNEEREEIKSPKSLGAQLVQLCRSGKLKGAIGIVTITNFLASNPDLTQCDRQGTALMWVSFFGLLDIVDLLILYKAPLNTTSDLGYTPLHAAAQTGHRALARVLVENGASVSAKAQCGYTPLHLAAQEGYAELMLDLIVRGANTEEQDNEGRTALHLAAWKGHVDAVKALIAVKAKINAQAHGGFTPLHAAAFGYCPEIAEVLIKAKADSSIVTDDGDSLMVSACKGGSKRMAKNLMIFLCQAFSPELGKVMTL